MRKLLKLWLAILAISLFASTGVEAQTTQTPNVGFQLPSYQQENWQVPIDFNFSMLDNLLGGSSLLATGATPTIGRVTTWVTQNTGATILTNFVGGYQGQMLHLICGASDSYTSITDSSNIVVAGTWSCPSGTGILLALYGTTWVELGRAGGSLGAPGPTGATGPPGPAGPQGAPGISATWQGTWSGSVNYQSTSSEIDAVFYNGSSYVTLINNNMGNQPDTNPSDWQLIAQRGAPGIPATWKGTWSGSVNYQSTSSEIDAVFYNGSSYVTLINNNMGNQPDTNPSDWQLIAQRGASGLPCTLEALSVQFNNAGALGCIPLTYTAGTTTLAADSSLIVDFSAAADVKVPCYDNAILFVTGDSRSIGGCTYNFAFEPNPSFPTTGTINSSFSGDGGSAANLGSTVAAAGTSDIAGVLCHINGINFGSTFPVYGCRASMLFYGSGVFTETNSVATEIVVQNTATGSSTFSTGLHALSPNLQGTTTFGEIDAYTIEDQNPGNTGLITTPVGIRIKNQTSPGAALITGIGPITFGDVINTTGNILPVTTNVPTLGNSSKVYANTWTNILSCPEGGAPSGVSGVDVIYCDSSTHQVKVKLNNGSALWLPNTDGSGVGGHCAEFTSAYEIIDNGSPCGSVPHAITFTIGTPGGTALSAGSTTTDYVTMPFGCTINAWNLLVDAGTITVEFWKVATGTAIPTSGNSINTSGVAISTGTAIHSTTLTDFTTTTIAANDIIAMNVTAASTAAYVNGVLQCQ